MQRHALLDSRARTVGETITGNSTMLNALYSTDAGGAVNLTLSLRSGHRRDAGIPGRLVPRMLLLRGSGMVAFMILHRGPAMIFVSLARSSCLPSHLPYFFTQTVFFWPLTVFFWPFIVAQAVVKLIVYPQSPFLRRFNIQIQQYRNKGSHHCCGV